MANLRNLAELGGLGHTLPGDLGLVHTNRYLPGGGAGGAALGRPRRGDAPAGVPGVG